jgi:hypothetical protein
VEGDMQLELVLSKWIKEWAAKYPPVSP